MRLRRRGALGRSREKPLRLGGRLDAVGWVGKVCDGVCVCVHTCMKGHFSVHDNFSFEVCSEAGEWCAVLESSLNEDTP